MQLRGTDARDFPLVFSTCRLVFGIIQVFVFVIGSSNRRARQLSNDHLTNA